MRNKVYIIPTGGLCNRMRAIASSIYLSKQMGCPATIYWNNTRGLCADFHDLFLPIQDRQIEVVENRKWLYNVEGTRDYIFRWPFLNLTHKIIFNHDKYSKGDFVLGKDGKSMCRKLLVISCHSMCQHFNLKELFVPRPDIQERINSVCAPFDEHTIGVHIRRTDNIQSINNSPIESFYHILAEEVKRNPAVKFYLASDDKSVKKDFLERYPNRIITCDNKTERSSLEGMKSAVVDLYCLSMTKKIIGSDYSSYSQIAAEMSGIQLEYAKIQ